MSMTRATRRLVNKEASAVARQYGVTPTLGFLARVREGVAEHLIPGVDVIAEVGLTAYCVADCFQPHPTCLDGAACGGCAAAIADGVVKGY